MSEFHDYVQLPAEGQVAPTFISQPGALTTGGLPLVTAQISTQTNPGGPSYGINSTVQYEQNLAVVGPIYQSPGGVLNKGSGLTTGGGP